MRLHFHVRSRFFRCLLVLAMLAWVGLAFDAVAHPLMMAGMPGMAGMSNGSTSMTMGGAAPQGGHTMSMVMSPTAHLDVPAQPVGNGHGCCHHGSCHCASLCTSILGVARLDLPAQPPHEAVFTVTLPDVVLARSAPPFRPPIA